MNDLFALAILLFFAIVGGYVVGRDRGRQAGWADAQMWAVDPEPTVTWNSTGEAVVEDCE